MFSLHSMFESKLKMPARKNNPGSNGVYLLAFQMLLLINGLVKVSWL